MEGNYLEREEARKMRRQQREKKVKRQRFIIFFTVFAVVLFIAIVSISYFAYANDQPESVECAKYYKSIMVYQGDTLDSIADQYITDEYPSKEQYIYEVSCINALSDDTELIAGNYLIIPYYTQLTAQTAGD